MSVGPEPPLSCDLRLNHARFWLRELRISRHFSTFYGRSVQSMDTQLGAGKGGGPRRSTEVVLNDQSLPVAWWSHDGREEWPVARQ